MSFLPPEYGPNDDETPEAKMFREQQAWEEKDQAAVERLIKSLRPEHARMPLISWANIQKWKLKRRTRPL